MASSHGVYEVNDEITEGTAQVVTRDDNPFIVLANKVIDSGKSIDEIGKLLDMAESFNKNRAEEAFARDLALVQSKIGRIFKTKKNEVTNSRYTPFEDVLAATTPVVTDHGFSMSFTEEDCPKEGECRFVLVLLHRQGHSRRYQLDMANDDTGMKGGATKTRVQGKASSTSYARRYLTYMALNVETGENDRDGNPPPADVPYTKDGLRGLVAKYKVNEAKMAGRYNASGVDDMDDKSIAAAIDAIVAANRK